MGSQILSRLGADINFLPVLGIVTCPAVEFKHRILLSFIGFSATERITLHSRHARLHLRLSRSELTTQSLPQTEDGAT